MLAVPLDGGAAKPIAGAATALVAGPRAEQVWVYDNNTATARLVDMSGRVHVLPGGGLVVAAEQFSVWEPGPRWCGTTPFGVPTCPRCRRRRRGDAHPGVSDILAAAVWTADSQRLFFTAGGSFNGPSAALWTYRVGDPDASAIRYLRSGPVNPLAVLPSG